jgi:hypothetical protein
MKGRGGVAARGLSLSTGLLEQTGDNRIQDRVYSLHTRNRGVHEVKRTDLALANY